MRFVALLLLQTSGVPARLVVVQNAGHGFGGGEISPARAEIGTTIGDFFDKYLK